MHACDEARTGARRHRRASRARARRRLPKPRAMPEHRLAVGEQQLELEAAQRVERLGIGPDAPRSRRRRSARRAGAARRRAARRARTASQAAAPSRRSDVGGQTVRLGQIVERPRPRSCRRRAGSPGRRSARPARLRACGPRRRRRSASAARASTPSPRATRAAARPPTIASDGELGRPAARVAAAPMRAWRRRAACASVRPRRPRPASWTSARTTVNAGAPARASARSSSCVEPQRSSSIVRGRIDHRDTIGR